MLLIGGGAIWYSKSHNEQANKNHQVTKKESLMSQTETKVTKDSTAQPNSSDSTQTANETVNNSISIQSNLDELSRGEQIANAYDSIRINMIRMLNELAAGQGSIDNFYRTCDTALAERQKLLNEAQLVNVSYKELFI
jgi:hypothetical protein